MFGLARIGVLKSHTGCVESTRPRGVLGLVTIFFFFFRTVLGRRAGASYRVCRNH